MHSLFSRHGTALSECGRCSSRPSHLRTPGVPKMARAALLNIPGKRGQACLLFGGKATR